MADGADIVARRHAAILDIARHAGRVTVEMLVARLDVTPQTIRRDLNLLAGRALLARVHGGAVVTSGTSNVDHQARRHVAREAKRAIGAAAAALIPDGASLFVNIGTTTEVAAHALADRRDLMVVTNNLNVVDILADRPTIQVIAAGGRVRAHDRAVVGPLAIDFIAGFRVDYALIGASSIDHDGTLLDYDIDEVRVARTIIAQARTVILLADATKVGRAAPVRIGALDAVDVLVTDRLTDDRLRIACGEAGVRVVETG